MRQILAINNYVTVEMIKEPKKPTGQFILPDTIEKNPRWGKVLSAGDGVPDLGGHISPLDVAVGDLIYIAAHGKERIPTETLEDGDGMPEIHCCSVMDVMGKMVEGKFIPLGAYIAIDKIEAATEKSGFKLADSMRANPNFGVVKTLGLGWKTVDGKEIPFQVAENDLVAYLPFQTMIVDMSALGIEKEIHLIQHGSILGKVV